MKRLWILMTTLLIWTVGACESDPEGRSSDGTIGDNADPTDTAGGGTGTDTAEGGQNNPRIPGDTDTGERIQMTCDEDGTCYCLRMGVIGTFDSAAHQNDVSAFVEWLNNRSNAIVTMVSTQPSIAPQFLESYDILLFLNQAATVNGPFWSYTAQDASNLRAWIEAGGGIITVTGFNGMVTPQEVGAMNSILEPTTGISYNNDKYLAESAIPNDGYCWGNAAVIDGWDPEHPISREVQRIAAFWGSSINAPPDAQIVATAADAQAITNNAIVSVEIGRGRALAIADEWPLLTNVWQPGTNQQIAPNPYDPCYDTDLEHWKHAENHFQHPQFWYNAIWWTAPENDCFEIDEPVIIPID